MYLMYGKIARFGHLWSGFGYSSQGIFLKRKENIHYPAPETFHLLGSEIKIGVCGICPLNILP